MSAQSPEKGEILAVATTAVFRFKDDLGANARPIRDFQAELGKRLRQ